MNDNRLATYGALLLRVTLGVAFLAHGLYLKVFVFTMPGTMKFFQTLGLPGALAWVVMLVETIAGVMLIVGFKARWAALGAFPILVGAVWTHSGAGWLFTSAGGGWEYPAFWASALLVQAAIGSGAYALDSVASPSNAPLASVGSTR